MSLPKPAFICLRFANRGPWPGARVEEWEQEGGLVGIGQPAKVNPVLSLAAGAPCCSLPPSFAWGQGSTHPLDPMFWRVSLLSSSSCPVAFHCAP